MSLKDLSDLDFSFYCEYAKKMRNTHDKEFMEVIDPELMRAFYRGKNKKANLLGIDTDSKEHFITYSRIFQASNTILPNLYYQTPRIMAIAKRKQDNDSAALMTAAQNHYNAVNDAKRENQESVMNAWFFGIGWKKCGYRTVFMPKEGQDQPENKLGMMGQAVQGIKSILGIKPDNLESKERPDIVDYETLFSNAESPMNIMLDHKANLRDSKTILHRLPRTLYDLKQYGDYDEAVLKEIFDKNAYKNGTRLDDREIDLTLNELHVQQRNGIWILTWVEEHTKPLRYELSTYQGKGFQFTPLVLTNEPNVRYPVSHLKVSTQQQEHLDYLATLWVKLIDKVRNQIIVNKKDLEPGQDKSIEKNRLGGVVWANKPINPGTFAQLTSAPVQNDLINLMNLLQQNITEIMGTDEQIIGGKSSNKTLGQDQLARMGSQIRESGMLDKVRDWLIEQAKKEGAILKQYSNAELHLQITGKDYSDKQTGQTMEEKWVEFMTELNPLGLKNYLTGEFDYDLSIYEATKPDKPTLRQQYSEIILAASQPQVTSEMLQRGKRVKVEVLFENWMKNFDGMGDPEAFIEDLDPQQVAAVQASQVLMARGGELPPSSQTAGPAKSPAVPQGQEAAA